MILVPGEYVSVA